MTATSVPLAGSEAQILHYLTQVVAIGRHNKSWTSADVQRVSEAHLEHPHTLRRQLSNERARADRAEVEVAALRAKVRQLMATQQPLPERSAVRRVVYLTPKRNDVLQLMVTGASRREIAERLRISESSVADRTRRLVAELGVKYQREAIALWHSGAVDVRVLDEGRHAA